MDHPIIASRLDTDFYKLTMALFIWKRWREVPVKYALTNRTVGVPLAELIDSGELREQLDHLKHLQLSQAEADYLLSLGLDAEFVRWLSEQRTLPDYGLGVKDGQYVLEFAGSWLDTIWWETPALAILNELANRAFMRQAGQTWQDAWAEGERRLLPKLEQLTLADLIKLITEFGTRRRWSRAWQEKTVHLTLERAPNLLAGTSNVALARTTGLPARGTMAHELSMAYQGIYGLGDSGLRASQKWLLGHWWEEFGKQLSIALTDTYGSEVFFQDFTFQQATNWKGLRQDSGDPVAFGNRAIDFYRRCGIDPCTKLVMFSDGLTAERMLELERHFRGRIKTAYGWGTNFTNDCGYQPLSLVIKLVEANGQPTVKLSDNLNKAIGPKAAVERVKRVFGYTNTLRQECVY
jgi:nicotinate phosphoribosyltransferase